MLNILNLFRRPKPRYDNFAVTIPPQPETKGWTHPAPQDRPEMYQWAQDNNFGVLAKFKIR